MKFFRHTDKRNDAKPAPKKQLSKNIATRVKPDPRVPLAQNTVVDGYRIEKVVGRGSFSLVYAAVEIESKLNVVIKEYFPKHFSERDENGAIFPFDGKKLLTFNEGFKQFYSEALALKKITHPNVLNTHNLFRANKTAYLVSLNQDGRDLKWFLTSFREPLNQNLIYKVFLPILSALNFLHEAQLLHLDIKPANILLQPNSESLLLDFGAAQTMSSNKRISHMQTLTHGFAPPEQYDKNRALGPWTDIYAVAATLYYSIACRPPSKSKDSKVASQLDLNDFRDRYHVELLETINRSLSHDASERFDNIDEFASALLQGSKWSTLREYEISVMGYNRHSDRIRHSQEDLISFVA